MQIIRDNIRSHQPLLSGSDIINYPRGFNLAVGHDGRFQILLGGLMGTFLPLMLAYNMTVVIIMLLNVYVSAFCFKGIAKLASVNSAKDDQFSDLKAILGGVFFGLSPYVLTRLGVGHLNLGLVCMLPLVAYAMVNLYAKLREGVILPRDVGFVAFSILFVSIASLFYLVFGLLIVCFFLPLFLLQYRALAAFFRTTIAHPRKILSFVAWIACSILLFVYAHSEIIRVTLDGTLNMRNYRHSPWDVALIFKSLFIPNSSLSGPVQKLGWYSGSNTWDSAFLGLSGIAILITVLFHTRSRKDILSVASTLLILSALIFDLIPVYGVDHIQSLRYSILLMMYLAILFCTKPFFTKKIVAGMFVILFIERLIFGMYVSAIWKEDFFRQARQLPGEATLVIPGNYYAQSHSWLPYFLGKKVTSGFYHWTARTEQNKPLVADKDFAFFSCKAKAPPDGKVFDQLLRLNIHSIFVDANPIYAESCKPVATWLESQKNLRKVVEGRPGKIYEILDPDS